MDTPDPIEYMDAAAAAPAGLAYKRRLLGALAVRPGQTVADLGCGPGTDLGRIAGAAGSGGTVIGVDHDEKMLAEARRRYAHLPNVTITPGDLHDLPLPAASADRARADRVLQHVASPARVIAEARRVLRPGGLLGMAEPDWDTLAVADEDTDVSRRFARYVAGGVRNATIGRDLVRLSAQAGLGIHSAEAVPILFRDFPSADQFLGLTRNTARAVRDGALNSQEAAAWLDRLTAGPVIAGFTVYLVVARHISM
ncbi:methyltransferase domain-containing protein [Longispora albida]|uniref:methyltransferase domain-containing protein n=1 Tax=Longispora albida TaxID=203523 RepID=UPI0003700BE1|nr:methyltransferase domain-containing protein [Longispora albida]